MHLTILFLFVTVSKCVEHGLTPSYLLRHDEMVNLGEFGDAEHRGPDWYDYQTTSSESNASEMKNDFSDSTSSVSTESTSSSESSGASSFESTERKRATRSYRTCHPCPWDLLKKYKNKGIKWICAGYQRARRTFKSVCMMRYRNCQDGTMDIALSKREKKKKEKSTSSSQSKSNSGSEGEISLDLSSSSSSTSSNEDKSGKGWKKDKYKPKSSDERTGWKKWHRKCTPCPEDMRKKWRDPSIGWICGGYQRARRSFKSTCMMHYRNCQDGTMFVKIHAFKCNNDSNKDVQKHGDHFFYDYNAKLSDESSSSRSDSSSESSSKNDWKNEWMFD